MVYKYERIAWVVTCALFLLVGYYVGQKKPPVQAEKKNVKVEVVSDGADVSREIEKSFGWASSESELNIEAIEVEKGVAKNTGDYKFPTPSIKFSIRNNGNTDLESFGINVTILDVLNKKVITSWGQASGFIKHGWTTQTIHISASGSKWKELTKNSPINIPVMFIVSAKSKSGDKVLFKALFDQSELQTLPEIIR